MKVLFYPIVDIGRIHCNRIYCDYQMDCIFHGLRTELGEDCVDYLSFPTWYDDVKKEELYGNGFTIYGLLPRISIDRDDLDAKIRTGYFDQIIVGIHNNRYNHPNNLEIIKNLIGEKGNFVKVICGNDEGGIDSAIPNIAPFFKRELQVAISNVYPISFCIPEEKVVKDVPNKTNYFSTTLPNHNGVDGWKIKNEEEYYETYRTASFGLTYKKGGWDSLRHYEILMNGCIPLFPGLEQCPELTMSNFPKDIVKDVMEDYLIINGGNIQLRPQTSESLTRLSEIHEELLFWTRKFLTTRAVAKYVLGVK